MIDSAAERGPDPTDGGSSTSTRLNASSAMLPVEMLLFLCACAFVLTSDFRPLIPLSALRQPWITIMIADLMSM